MNQLDDKEFYSELTEKQQAVVDAILETPNADNTTIADQAGVSRGTVHNVKEHYPHIIESKLNEKGRSRGEEHTTGSKALFESLEQSGKGVQHITERPHTNGDESPTETIEVDESGPQTLTVELTRQDVEDLITTGQASDALIKSLLDRLLERAFE